MFAYFYSFCCQREKMKTTAEKKKMKKEEVAKKIRGRKTRAVKEQ
jgi:hypothetical protein